MQIMSGCGCVWLWACLVVGMSGCGYVWLWGRPPLDVRSRAQVFESTRSQCQPKEETPFESG